MPAIFDTLLPMLPNGSVLSVQIGLFWTAVLVETGGKKSCGLASTQTNPEYEHARFPAIHAPGQLESYSALRLAELVYSESLTEVSVGMAAINALLPKPEHCIDMNADEYIARQGPDTRVAIIGHFPFVERLRPQVRDLWVLELNPKEGDLPAVAEPEIIPQADILAVTSTTLINHTFDDVFQHRKQGAKVMLLGPSTPMSPVLFEIGVDVLSGSIVEDPEKVFNVIRQGANFRQVKSQGIRLVTIAKDL